MHRFYELGLYSVELLKKGSALGAFCRSTLAKVWSCLFCLSDVLYTKLKRWMEYSDYFNNVRYNFL